MVKTHEKGPAAHRGYNKAVLLVRDPMQAIQAEFNRQGGGHIGFASPDRYRNGKGKCKNLFFCFFSIRVFFKVNSLEKLIIDRKRSVKFAPALL